MSAAEVDPALAAELEELKGELEGVTTELRRVTAHRARLISAASRAANGWDSMDVHVTERFGGDPRLAQVATAVRDLRREL